MDFKRNEFFEIDGWKRIYRLDKFTLIAIFLGLILLVVELILSYSSFVEEIKRIYDRNNVSTITMILEDFDSMAHAETEKIFDKQKINPKPLLNLFIMICMGISYFWALFVTLHSRSATKTRIANDILKTLLGFFLGCAKSYMIS